VRSRLVSVALWAAVLLGCLLAVYAASQTATAAARRAAVADGLERALAAAPAGAATAPYDRPGGRAGGQAGTQSAAVPPPASAPRGHAVARLEISRVGLSTSVVEGVGNRELDTAVGHDPRSVLPGVADNSVLSGHREREFATLDRVRVGDEVVTRAPYGGFRWQVRDIRVIEAEDRTVLVPTRPQPVLTLTTCYPLARWQPPRQRLVITAALVERIAPSRSG
jgi:sortase A